jgi:hypothetical protein
LPQIVRVAKKRVVTCPTRHGIHFMVIMKSVLMSRKVKVIVLSPMPDTEMDHLLVICEHGTTENWAILRT